MRPRRVTAAPPSTRSSRPRRGGTGAIRLRPRAPPETLRGHAERPVELAGRVLPGDDRGQLDQRVVVIEPAQPGEELVVHVEIAPRDGVGVLEGGPLRVVVEGARPVLG